MMADEIFCSEAWARFDPANVARQGAGSYALPLELADAEKRAAMCQHRAPYRRTTQPQCAPTARSFGWSGMATPRTRQRT